MRRPVEHRDGVVAGEARSCERNRLDVGGRRLDAVEESGIELPGLELPDERGLRVDV